MTADTVWPDARRIVEASMINAPRSLQKQIGPSELGISCERCLAHKLAGTPERPQVAWLPQIGTAVHEWLEGVFLRHEHARVDLGMPSRYLPEHRVTVGTVGGVPITGSTDLFDLETGTVMDWKVCGATTIKAAKGNGASLQYQRQAHLYGRGWVADGYTVNTVMILFLPRNSVTLADTYVWQAPYDESVALATLQRADTLADDIATRGLDTVLAGLPPHDGIGFSCKRAVDWSLPNTNTDPFGS